MGALRFEQRLDVGPEGGESVGFGREIVSRVLVFCFG